MRSSATRVVVLVVVLLGTACAADAAPKEPPPTVPGVQSAPPPAWIETRAADRWLAFFSYCWTSTCIDSRPVEQRIDIPRIRVVRGEVVRIHLGFRPTELTLVHGSRRYRLDAQRVAKWQVRGGSGVARWIARSKGLRAEYVARLVVQSP